MKKQDSDRENDIQKKLEPYNAQMERYLKKNSSSESHISAKGKILFVDEKTRKADDFSKYTSLPYKKPNNPNEVDSVVLRNCDYVEVGQYTNGSKAMQHVCKFTVIDVATGLWSDWGEYKGSMPSENIKRKHGSTSDENGSLSIFSFFHAGGVTTKPIESSQHSTQ